MGATVGGQRLEGVFGCMGPLRPEKCAGVEIGGVKCVRVCGGGGVQIWGEGVGITYLEASEVKRFKRS